MKVFYDPAYNATKHAWDTTRKASLVANYLRVKIPQIVLKRPKPLTVEDLLVCHSQEYIDAVRTGMPGRLACSNGFDWCEGLFPAVCSSNGGVLAACRQAMEDGAAGSLSSGLHHAHRDQGGGFCTFNGLAIAAIRLADSDFRVLIVDYDAHYGDGTSELIRPFPTIHQVDVSTSNFRYGQNNAFDYLMACVNTIDATNVENYNLVIYNAGMDPHEDCTIGGLRGVDDRVLLERDQFVFQHCARHRVPVAFALAGGYANNKLTNERLTRLHATTCELAYNHGYMYGTGD